MKYLLACPACGREIPVEAGQAGQTLQCTCGKPIEVPSIRNLRQMKPAVEEPVAPLWSKRQGLMFLGSVITLCALAFAAAIWIYRPAPIIPPAISIDEKAVDQEVQALSAAEGFRRFAMIESRTPALVEERLHSKEIPPFLMISAKQLVEFEGGGPQPLAAKQTALVAEKAIKESVQLTGNNKVRAMLNQWLIMAAAVAVAGIVISSFAFLIRRRPSQNPPPLRRRD